MGLADNFKRLLLFLALAILFYAGSPAACEAFGVSPPWVKTDRLVPGSTYEQKVTISRYKPTTDLKATIDYSKLSEELKGWISVKEGDEFILPKGENQIPIHFVVEVPDSAALKNYQGSITVKTHPTKEGAGVGVALAAGIHIDLTVSDREVEDMLVRYVNIKKVVERKPIPFHMKIENRGNVSTKPDKVELKIYDQYYRQVITEGSATEMEEIAPFETKTIVANVPIKLEMGTYWAEFKILKNENVLRKGKIVFNVVEREPNILEKAWMFLWNNKRYSIPAFILVLIFVVLTVLVKKGKLHVRIELGSPHSPQEGKDKKKEEKEEVIRIKPGQKT